MVDAASKQLLRELSLAAGPPGGEDEVRAVVRRRLAGVGSLSHDRLGSLICELPGSAPAPRVMIDSHLDEVAFMVQSIQAEGRLGFVTLGSWWGHVLLGQRVHVLTDRGRLTGVIGCKPPHFLSAAEREKVLSPDSMYIDLGSSTREEVERLGVRPGDLAVPASEFEEMPVDGVVGGKAVDNRVGVALMCDALAALAKRGHPNTVVGVAAAQEEVGARGAATATHAVRPDAAVVLECTPADDLPGVTERQAVLGAGPQIRWFDPTAISNRRLVRHVEEVARAHALPIQLAVRRSGGTDAGSIHRSLGGVPTVVVGVPARYIHSHFSLMRWDDYDAARALVVELAASLDGERVTGLTTFD
jgi:endoglucanase